MKLNENVAGPDYERLRGYVVKIRAEGLPVMDLKINGGRLDPYIIIRRKDTGDVLYQTEFHDNDLTPVFAKLFVHKGFLNVADQLTFDFWDYDKIGQDDYVGSFTCSWCDILSFDPDKLVKYYLCDKCEEPVYDKDHGLGWAEFEILVHGPVSASK